MHCFLLLSALGVAVIAAPQEYAYKEPAPVSEQDGFLPLAPPRVLPCAHASHHLNNTASALIQSQYTARIVNHQKQYSADNNLITAISGYNTQSQQTNADKASISQGANQTFLAGQGYVQNERNFVAPVPPQMQPFNSVSIGGGQQLEPVYSQGYAYNQDFSSQGQNHVHQHNQTNFETFNSQPQNLIRPSVYPLPTNGGNKYYQNGYAGSFDYFGHSLSHLSSITAAHNVQHAANGGSSLNFGNAESSSFSSSVARDTLNGQLGNVIRETFANTPLDPSIEKHIYIYVPPEDLEENKRQQFVAQHQLITPTKKHYKIIFIKAPSAPEPSNSQLAAVVPQAEEKTLVYILVKKPDEPSLEQIQQIQQTSYKSRKPEVYFIKYKTRKENELGLYSASSQIPNGLYDQPQSQHAHDVKDVIDIRSGGNSSPITTSTSYTSPSSSSSSTDTISEGKKHELYGVPLN